MTLAKFMDIKIGANGMLPPEVYREIHDQAAGARGHVVEIGTAHGASAIAAALGLNPAFSVHTIDKIVGGTRDKFGGVEENKKIIEQNFARFNLSDRIFLHIGYSTEIAPKLDFEQPIGMLMIDADGAVDRDLALFYDRLAPGAPIVIDDFAEDRVLASRLPNGKLRVDQKFRLTAALVMLFEKHGLLTRRKVVKSTWFGVKPDTAPAFAVDRDEILSVYRGLTFSDAILESRVAAAASDFLAQRFPRTRQKIKELVGRSKP